VRLLNVNVIAQHVAAKNNLLTRFERWHTKIRTRCTPECVSQATLIRANNMMTESVTKDTLHPSKYKLHFVDILTLPQEDAGGIVVCALASASNCSASPHEQFLHAFRFPLVSQSGPVLIIIFFR